MFVEEGYTPNGNVQQIPCLSNYITLNSQKVITMDTGFSKEGWSSGIPIREHKTKLGVG